MKNLFILTLGLVIMILSCKNSKMETVGEGKETLEVKTPDNLYQLDYQIEENNITINAAEQLNFYLPDSSVKTEAYKFEDFNGDGTEDVLVYLGACGTGGCMYGLFLNQYDNYYKLAYMDYLKGPKFEKEANGQWSITSYEEVRAYDPSKIHVTIYKFDQESYYYNFDTTYIYYDTLTD